VTGAGTIAERLATVRAELAEACRAAGRDPASVRLVAVSKTMPASACAEALAAGQRDLGENYAQELRDKARDPLLSGAVWHFIGPLQRNKVKYVVGTAALVHSVDSAAILDEIAARAAKLGVVQRVLLQVNVGREPQKAGVPPEELAALVEAARAKSAVRLEGLMCIPPAEGDPRPHFELLARLAKEHALPELSMGMTADFPTAIACGATLIRVGTAIFGARVYQ
jgi:pyridoxal phosphate enzyme (YggS family)